MKVNSLLSGRESPLLLNSCCYRDLEGFDKGRVLKDQTMRNWNLEVLTLRTCVEAEFCGHIAAFTTHVVHPD